MIKLPSFELAESHRYFAAHCFNKTWDFIDKPSRSEEEEEAMLHTCLASLWHWSQRDNVTAENFSVGYWQASRVFALLGRADDARKYARRSLEKSRGLAPFYEGYAYEALARSESVAGNHEKVKEYLAQARKLCEAVEDVESRKLLSEDLDQINSLKGRP